MLLSAQAQNRRTWTPPRIKNAIVNTSKRVDDNASVGMIKVEKAWEYLKQYTSNIEDVLFEV